MADCGGCCGRRKKVSACGGVKFQKPARSVPTWQERFCREVGCIPWERVEDALRSTPPDAHPVNLWDNSAGEEALYKAMVRYVAELNGLPCRIPLPSPDMYIDEIDWSPSNNCIEPELLHCLDEAPADK